jgi:hypothetical protein
MKLEYHAITSFAEETNLCSYCAKDAEGFYVWKDGTLTLACESCGTLIDKIAERARAANEAEESEGK